MNANISGNKSYQKILLKNISEKNRNYIFKIFFDAVHTSGIWCKRHVGNGYYQRMDNVGYTNVENSYSQRIADVGTGTSGMPCRRCIKDVGNGNVGRSVFSIDTLFVMRQELISQRVFLMVFPTSISSSKIQFPTLVTLMPMFLCIRSCSTSCSAYAW